MKVRYSIGGTGVSRARVNEKALMCASVCVCARAIPMKGRVGEWRAETEEDECA